MASTRAPSLPDGFVDLATARQMADGKIISTIGVVIDIMPTKRTHSGTGNWMISFKLLDRSLADSSSLNGREGLPVRFFRPEAYPNEIPKIENVGDVVLLRGVKMTTFSSQRIALSESRRVGSALVFAKDRIPEPRFALTYMGGQQKLNYAGTPNQDETLSIAEQVRVIDVKHEMRAEVASTPSIPKGPRADYQPFSMHPSPSSVRASLVKSKRPPEYEGMEPKFKLVRDMACPGWSDICGQVVKTFATRYGGYDLYITDYTTHEKTRYYPPPEEADGPGNDGHGETFYHLETKREWPGPWGRLVLKLNVKEPHARYVDEHVRPGDWVWLKNVKARIAPDGTFEGDMWPDQQNSDKVCVQKAFPGQLAVQRASERKDQYWSQRKQRAETTESKARAEEAAIMRNSMDQAVSGASGRAIRKEKKEKKKKKDNPDLRKAANTERHEQNASCGAINATTLHDKVRCSHEEIPVTRVKDILDLENKLHTDARQTSGMEILPFVNVRYRARVRVVDFEPKALKDFAVLAETGSIDGEDDDMQVSYATTRNRYEWYFALCLENVDASTKVKQAVEDDRIWVHLHHEQATYLLGNNVEDPDDLKANPALLAKLREQLFYLWGNLEEGQGKELNNRPFECCIMEYGIELDDADAERQTSPGGWKRMYGMFGTTII